VLHHILDPRTGLPAEPVWRTVSVAAGSCADANTASTAAVIRGRRALGWLAQLGLPARLVDATGVVFTVAGWPDEAHPDGARADQARADEARTDEAHPHEPSRHQQSEAVQK
jgi:thiamine biosynthesis lipoprotein